MTTNMTATPAMTPLVTREELLTTGEAFDRSCKALGSRYTPEQLIEQIGDHYGKARGHFAKGLNQLIETGKRIEALKRHGEYGTYMDRIEALGIGRTSAQNYRDLARFAAHLRAEPGFATMSLNDAKALVVGYKAALKDDDLEDESNADDQQGKAKPRRRGRGNGQQGTGGRLDRLASRIVQLVRESRHTEPDILDQLDHVIARIQHVRSQLKSDVVDAGADDQGEG